MVYLLYIMFQALSLNSRYANILPYSSFIPLRHSYNINIGSDFSILSTVEDMHDVSELSLQQLPLLQSKHLQHKLHVLVN